MLLLVEGAGGRRGVEVVKVVAGDALMAGDTLVAGDTTSAEPFSQDCLRFFFFLSPSDPDKVSSAHDWHRK